MNSLGVILIVAFLSGTAQAQPSETLVTENIEIDPLLAAVEACQDALYLGDKSTAFAIARKIRTEALLRFSAEPHQLAPLLLLYADAAASYQDAGALIAYREAAATYERAFGPESDQLIEPLMRAAREALGKRFRVEAFNLFQRTLELSAAHGREKSAQAAIARTGIASLHLRVGELAAARAHLGMALEVDHRTVSQLDLGWIYHVSADTYLAQKNWKAADEHYTQAYGHYEAVNQYSRDLRTILRRLIEANHMIGNPERATSFCQMYARKRDWGRRMLFDPSNKITATRSRGVATVSIEYTINSQCRAEGVVVTQSDGMDAREVKEIVESAYWLPRYRDGAPTSTALQKVSSFIIAN